MPPQRGFQVRLSSAVVVNGPAEKVERKCYKRCKNIAAFIAVRGVKG